MLNLTQILEKKYILYSQRMFGTFLACMFWMVQGDIRLIKPQHWLVGLKTAFVSSTILLIISLTDLKVLLRAGYPAIFTTACVVAVSDHFVHPGHFGGEYGEAIITGITAASIVTMFGLIKLSLKK